MQDTNKSNKMFVQVDCFESIIFWAQRLWSWIASGKDFDLLTYRPW